MTAPSSIAAEFTQRLADIRERSKSTFDLREIESSLEDLLAFIQDHPAHESEFRRIFEAVIAEDREGMTEVLEFTMHTLRWREIREVVEAMRDSSPSSPAGYQQRRWAIRVLDAYRDDWENADLYSHYR